MARETGQWLAALGPAPSQILSTDTQRTRQTAEELCLALDRPPAQLTPLAPELMDEWEMLVEGPLATNTDLLYVGHHPTIEFALRAFGPPPTPMPRALFACALVLEPSASGWHISHAWPGRQD